MEEKPIATAGSVTYQIAHDLGGLAHLTNMSEASLHKQNTL